MGAAPALPVPAIRARLRGEGDSVEGRWEAAPSYAGVRELLVPGAKAMIVGR